MFRRIPCFWRIAVTLTAMLPGMAVAESPPSTPAPESVPVILYSIDTVRADHCSAYGYLRDTTPFIQAWAASDAVVFERALTQDAWTLPAHMSILTGLYPKHHQVTETRSLAEEVITVAELLTAAGYQTAGFTGSDWWMAAKYGFNQGFATYNTPESFRYCAETTRLAMQWLDQHASENFFLFLHNFDVHSKAGDMGYPLPYMTEDKAYQVFSSAIADPPTLVRTLPEKVQASDFLEAVNKGKFHLTPKEHDYLLALYDDGVYGADCDFAALIRDLKQRGVYERSLIVLLSDHGESFGEHGKYLHGEAYESCAHVPLMIKFPGGRFAGRRMGGVTQLVDIAPTLLETLGRPVPAALDGQSLLAVLEGRSALRPYAYTRRFSMEAVSTNEWKLFRDNVTLAQYELYQLPVDPGEQTNRSAEALATQGALRDELQRFYAPARNGWNFRLVTGPSGAVFTLRLRTDGRIAAQAVAKTQPGILLSTQPDTEGRTLDVAAQLPPDATLEWVLQMAPARAPVSMDLTASAPLSGKVNGQALNGSTASLQLTPPPADIPHEATGAALPELAVWFEDGSTAGAPLPAFTNEEREGLEALGYVGAAAGADSKRASSPIEKPAAGCAAKCHGDPGETPSR